MDVPQSSHLQTLSSSLSSAQRRRLKQLRQRDVVAKALQVRVCVCVCVIVITVSGPDQETARKPAVLVFVGGVAVLGAQVASVHGLHFTLLFWIGDVVKGRWAPQSEVMFTIWRKFRDAGIEIPFPQRDVHIKSSTSVLEG